MRNSLTEILEDSLSIVQHKLNERKIELHIENDNEIFLECQTVQISQIIVNLISNASDAIFNLSDKWIKLNLSADENYLTMVITDSGNGIPEELRKKIFMSLFTTKAVGQGTGLGMGIIKK